MIIKRASEDRGPSDAGWLKSMHTFSFGHYYDSDQMGFGPLRVINDDHVIAGAGFQTHPHKNMEIISYVLSGELAHKDSMGNGSVIKQGEVQLMSAGTGVTHSEFNNSNSEEVHFLQIWVMPNVENTQPEYHQKQIAETLTINEFATVVSPQIEDGAMQIKQEATLKLGRFESGTNKSISLSPDRLYWIHVASGELLVNGQAAKTGDGFSFSSENELSIEIINESEILFFDMAQ